ncbi:MAG TPA: hypothetical protein PLW31_05145 [Bacteroidales bacterium]|nr:hypothetical protein [Bacteroidales bacterium]HOX77408.1 hypothetical protein [Bacteroidales bacterium]HPI86255.1 hypothetical protein [Bacteroidales bacterium]HPM93568.1 hypothetical protein [Bacteroidales bacterium]
MKKRFIFLVIWIILIGLNSCKQNDPIQLDCDAHNYGFIYFQNNSNDTYGIWIDGIFKMEVTGGTVSQAVNISEGNNRKLKAKQLDGYLIWPTEVETSFNVLSCSSYTWQFP